MAPSSHLPTIGAVLASVTLRLVTAGRTQGSGKRISPGQSFVLRSEISLPTPNPRICSVSKASTRRLVGIEHLGDLGVKAI
jgi:hypothetical protein